MNRLARLFPIYVREGFTKRRAFQLLTADNNPLPRAGKGSRAKRRAARFGVVATSEGVGVIREDGMLQGAFYAVSNPRDVRPATLAEIAGFLRHRAAVSAEVGGYYDRKTFTGD